MNYKFNFSVLALVALIGMSVGCSPKSNTGAAAGSLGSGGVQLNQSPLMSCNVTNLGNPTPLMHVTNITYASNLSAPPVAPATIGVNCANSVSASGGSVSVAVNVDGVPSGQLINNNYSQTFPNPGSHVVTITAIDVETGASSTAKFNLPVSCNPLNYAPISMNLAGISFSKGAGGPGYLNVVVPAATGGSGSGPFNYAIDLNGDGRFDDYQQQYWNPSNTFNNMYTLYNGVRTVSVAAYDTGCEMERVFTTSVDFSQILDPEQSGPTAVPESYYYLQGQVDTLSGSSDAADTVHPFDAMEAAVGAPQHVLCSYSNGNFNISAGNIYSDGNTSASESELKQSMELGLVASDNGAAGGFTQNGVSLTNLTYETAASPDGLYNQYSYSMDSSCTANLTVSRTTAVVPCAAGQSGTMSPVTTITGTYNCPHLSAPAVAPNPGGRAVSITNGYFYCQVAVTNNCAGGGQGGGGQPPPQF